NIVAQATLDVTPWVTPTITIPDIPTLPCNVVLDDVYIKGQNTNFAAGVSKADFGPGITVLSTSVLPPNNSRVRVQLWIPGNVTGPRAVTVTTNGEVAKLAEGSTFSVTSPCRETQTGSLGATTPGSVEQGVQSLAVNVGRNLGPDATRNLSQNFVSGVTQADF